MHREGQDHLPDVCSSAGSRRIVAAAQRGLGPAGSPSPTRPPWDSSPSSVLGPVSAEGIPHPKHGPHVWNALTHVIIDNLIRKRGAARRCSSSHTKREVTDPRGRGKRSSSELGRTLCAFPSSWPPCRCQGTRVKSLADV